MKYHISEFNKSIFMHSFKFSYFLLNLIFICFSTSLLSAFGILNSSFISTSFPNNASSPSFTFYSKEEIFCLSVSFPALTYYLISNLI